MIENLLPLGEGWTFLDMLYKRAVESRARLERWWLENPPQGKLKPPVIIAGPYRTGTTFLHRYMLETIPGHRSVLGWESWIPTPPPAENDPRIADAIKIDKIAEPMLAEVNLLHEEKALLPAECVSTMCMTDVTGMWPFVAACPEYMDYFMTAGGEDAYVFYDKCLRTIDPDASWILKAPMHSLFLPAIEKVWPGATIIRILRNAPDTYTSTMKFANAMRRISKPDQRHIEEIRGWLASYIAEHTWRINTHSRQGGKVITIFNEDLRQDPEWVVRFLVRNINELDPYGTYR